MGCGRSTYGFPGAEQDVGDDLGAGGGNEEAHGLVLRSLRAESELVDVLEHLVEAELSEALSRVANESREPAEGETLEALSGVDLSETVTDRLVETGVSLIAKNMD